jgi:two-component system response regulator LytT
VVILRTRFVDRALQLVVEDNGPGIPPGTKEGLGLRMVRERISLAHPGASLRLESSSARHARHDRDPSFAGGRLMAAQIEAKSRVLRALVVEDEWAARNYLVEMLHASGQAVVVAAVATLAEAQQALAPGGIVVDVAFVDIHLGNAQGDDEAGMHLVRTLAGTPGAPLFVLATALSQHAVEAYALGVADYLLKPIHEDRVTECLMRLQQRLAQTAPRSVPDRVVARSKKGLVLFARDEVWAFEAAERLMFVHTARGRFDVDLSLAAIEVSLGSEFLRVHRQWLVHTAHVRAIENEDGDTVVVVGDEPPRRASRPGGPRSQRRGSRPAPPRCHRPAAAVGFLDARGGGARRGDTRLRGSVMSRPSTVRRCSSSPW